MGSLLELKTRTRNYTCLSRTKVTRKKVWKEEEETHRCALVGLTEQRWPYCHPNPKGSVAKVEKGT